jgi:polar amino acid transport system substrate-binding protein
MSKTVRKLLLLSSLLITGVSIILFGYIWQDKSLDNIKNKGVIRVGYAIEAPYAFVDNDGNIMGESPVVAAHIIKTLDIQKIEWHVSDFSQLINDLNENRIDLIAAGMFITAERAAKVSFSNPVSHVAQGLLVTKNNPFNLHAYPDIVALPQQKLAVLSGSIEERLLQQSGITSKQLISVPDANTGYIAVISGQAAGLALSRPTLFWMLQQNKTSSAELATPLTQPITATQQKWGYTAFAFRKQDQQLIKRWNQAQDHFIGTAEHLRLIKPYGFIADDLPGKMTLDGVLMQ